MFLLIRGADYLNLNNSAFTFHYVSINTPDPLLLQLLKTSFTFHYVSINTIPSNAFLMIHKPWGAISGNADEMRKMADDLDKIQAGIMNVYEDHLAEGVAIDQVEALVDAETWLDGKEAAKYFNIAQTDAADYVAAVGDYLSHAGKLPEKFKSQQKQPKQTPKGPTPEEQAKAAADAEKRNQIKRLCIEGMTKGE